MLSPLPNDEILDSKGKFSRIWNVWIQNLQKLVNNGESASDVTEIVAADGIALGAHYKITRIISSTAGNTTVTKNPQIAPGFDGQVGVIEGSDNTKTVTIANGNGILLKGPSPFAIGNNDVIQFHCNKSKDLWIEDYRNT